MQEQTIGQFRSHFGPIFILDRYGAHFLNDLKDTRSFNKERALLYKNVWNYYQVIFTKRIIII
jgi:hypothetical protein